MFLFSLLSFLSVAVAFNPIVKEGVVLRGSTPPIKDFDPLNFAEKRDIAYLREAELKHGRWGMIGATSIPLIESFTHRPAIFEFQDLADTKQFLITGLIGAVEFQTMLRGWKLPWKEPFSLNDDYQPGDVGLGLLKDKTSDETGVLMDKELNNGRLAMIAFMGMLAQELVTSKPLI